MKILTVITCACLLAASTVFAYVDKNYNGLSDVYEFIYFNSPGDPFADDDDDGIITLDEMLWGTDPTDANSRIIAPFVSRSGTDLVLTWPSSGAYRVFELQGSTNMVTWQSLAVSPTATFTEHLNAPGTPRWQFYRLQATLGWTDSNTNDLADWEEALWQATYGQLPAATDLDGDHLPDDQELILGHDPGKKDHPAVGLIVFTPLEK